MRSPRSSTILRHARLPARPPHRTRQPSRTRHSCAAHHRLILIWWDVVYLDLHTAGQPGRQHRSRYDASHIACSRPRRERWQIDRMVPRWSPKASFMAGRRLIASPRLTRCSWRLVRRQAAGEHRHDRVLATAGRVASAHGSYWTSCVFLAERHPRPCPTIENCSLLAFSLLLRLAAGVHGRTAG